MREDHAADPNGYAEQMQKERRFDGFVHWGFRMQFKTCWTGCGVKAEAHTSRLSLKIEYCCYMARLAGQTQNTKNASRAASSRVRILMMRRAIIPMMLAPVIGTLQT
jgi:hypothetical protein